jgi:hypothetical protein
MTLPHPVLADLDDPEAVARIMEPDAVDKLTHEQLQAFAALTDEQKIAWLEEWQRATWLAATPAVRRSWWRLRGKEIPDHPDFRDPAPA